MAVNAGELSVQLKADDKASAKIKAASGNMTKSFNAIKNGAQLASAAILGAFAMSIKSFLDTGDALHKLSGRTDISVRTLEALTHVAGLAGQSISLFEGIAKIHNKNMLGLAEGTQIVTDNYAALGLTFDQLKIMSVEEQIIGLLGAMADLDDQTVKNNLGIDIFKGVWQPVKNLLQDTTGTAMKDAIEGFKELGFWTDETATEAAVFNDTIAHTQRALGMIVLELVRGHIPAMQLAATKTLMFIEKNKESIKQVASLVLTFAKFVAIMKIGAIAFAALNRAYLLSKGLVVVLIGLLSLLRKVFFTNFVIVKTKELAMKAYNKVVLFTTRVIGGLRKAMILARTATMLFYTTAIVPFLPIILGVAAGIGVVVGALVIFENITKGGVTRAVKGAIDWIKGLGEHLGFLKKAWDALIDTIKPWADKAKEAATVVKDKLVPSFESVSDEAAATSDIMKTLNTDFSDTSDIMKTLNTDFSNIPEVVIPVTEAIVELTDAEKKLNEILTTNIGAIEGTITLHTQLEEAFEQTSQSLKKQADEADTARIAWEAYHAGIQKMVAPHQEFRKGGGVGAFGGGGVGAFGGGGTPGMPSLSGKGATDAYMSAIADLIKSQGGAVNAATMQAKADKLNPFSTGNFGGGSAITNYFNTTTSAGVTNLLQQGNNSGINIEG